MMRDRNDQDAIRHDLQRWRDVLKSNTIEADADRTLRKLRAVHRL
jgi:hypothetical protein